MGEAVEQGRGHLGVAEDGGPFTVGSCVLVNKFVRQRSLKFVGMRQLKRGRKRGRLTSKF